MKKRAAWRRYLRFWRTDIAEDVDDELRFHTEMRVQEYIARGVTEEDARRAVAARLGDVEAAKAECIALGQARETHARQADFFDGLRTDVRFALRALGRSPGWTAVALITIALGIGAATTMLSVADALIIRPIAYPDASRVFVVHREMSVGETKVPWGFPLPAVREWRGNARSIEATAPFSRGVGQLGTGPDSTTVHAAKVDAGFLAFAGAHLLIGRNFTADEMLPNGPGAVLLGEDFWRRQYGASPDVIGKIVRWNSRSVVVVGVVPASLALPDFDVDPPDVWIPLTPSADPTRTTAVPSVIVRLKRGVSSTTATEELAAILKRSQLDFPPPGGIRWQLRLGRPQDDLKFRQTLFMLTGAVLLLLLVACTNVAHLLLARGTARQRELAVRHALGAGRSRLLRQLVTESIVLAVMGGALAALVGWAGLHVLAAARPASLTPLSYVSTNRGVISIAATLAIAAGLAIGLVSALRSAHRELGASLRVGASSPTRTGRRLRGSLVVGEVALSATLLVGALLLIHAVFDLQRMRLGFDVSDLYGISFPMNGMKAPESRAAFASFLRERSVSAPGVARVTVAAEALPTIMSLSTFETPERAAVDGEPQGSNAENFISPDYFSMMGIPLIAGRIFDAGSATRNEVIVSRSLADAIWPDGVVIGHRFRNVVPRRGLPIEPWQTVIGVVPDVVANLLQGSAEPTLYRPLNDADPFGAVAPITLVVRLHGNDATAAAALKLLGALGESNKSKPVIENVRERLDQSLAEPRFTMLILVTFATLGVVLAAIGLFGVISYSVGQRTREIGVRMTLGATRSSIARLVVGDGIRLALIGIALGLLGAVAATRLIQTLLYGVSRLDPFSFGVGATLLLAVSVVACVVPMLRATGVDPVVAVRVE